MRKYLIASSILSADFSRLGEEVESVLSSGADMIHLDVMDNHYVPNLTVGPLVLKALRNYGITAPIDVHLMIKPVDRIIPDFINAGADIITFHPETSEHVDRTLQFIKDHGSKAGLGINPATPLTWLEYTIDKLDLVLIMSVNPGFSGQLFISNILNKLINARHYIDKSKYNVLIEIDGGINVTNIGKVFSAGADILVIGSAIFSQNNYKKVINCMRNEINKINN